MECDERSRDGLNVDEAPTRLSSEGLNFEAHGFCLILHKLNLVAAHYKFCKVFKVQSHLQVVAGASDPPSAYKLTCACS